MDNRLSVINEITPSTSSNSTISNSTNNDLILENYSSKDLTKTNNQQPNRINDN